MNKKDYIKTRTFSKSRSIKSTAKLEPMRVGTIDKSISLRSVKINLPRFKHVKRKVTFTVRSVVNVYDSQLDQIGPILTMTWASKDFNVVSGIVEAF